MKVIIEMIRLAKNIVELPNEKFCAKTTCILYWKIAISKI